MYRFKYGNRRCYARTYAADAERALGGWIRRRDPQMIVPVPLYFGKRRKRGYNQAEVWAKALGERLGIPVEKRALLRLRATRPQKELNPAGRIYNLDRAFYARRDLVEGKQDSACGRHIHHGKHDGRRIRRTPRGRRRGGLLYQYLYGGGKIIARMRAICRRFFP